MGRIIYNWLAALGRSFADVPTPSSKRLDDFGGDSRRQRHPDEDEALVYCVCQGELCQDAYMCGEIRSAHLNSI